MGWYRGGTSVLPTCSIPPRSTSPNSMADVT
jgi:hypothetical protein